MGLFDKLFPKAEQERQVSTYFKTLNSYNPVYTSFEGGVYEMALTRACIHTFANHVSKMKPVVNGAANPQLNRKMQYKPNPYMDTKKYLYRLATIYKAQNNAFIIPTFTDGTREKVAGFYPILPAQTSVIQVGGQPYLKYQFNTGETAAVELERAGILNQYQYQDEFFGDSNANVLRPTLELLNAQNQSIINGVKSSANIRFLAKVSQVLKPSDMDTERKRLVESNLGADNSNGIMLFDAKYDDIKQISSTPYVVDDKQSALIRESVFDFFGMSENILQNKFSSDEWSAYYEGQLEPFAIELSLVHTNMAFSERDLSFGNEIIFTVNRLQYMAPSEKLQVATQLFDRGMLNANDGREMFQLPAVESGNKYFIRREYAEINALNREDGVDADQEQQGVPYDAVATDSDGEAAEQ